MARALWLSLVVLLSTAYGQQAQAASSFEVATVRPAQDPNPNNGHWSLPDTYDFHTRSLSLSYLIQLAWDIDAQQIEGKPAWLDTECFDIDAKPEAGIKLSREELRAMLQDLLQQRFHLAVHRETKVVPGYELLVAKGGAKLPPTKGGISPGTFAGALS